MRPNRGESILSYTTRLRGKANTCQFQDSCEERILEHPIQTIDNEVLIRKCMTKDWNLAQFLEEASRAEAMDLQVRNMQAIRGRDTRQVCNYCGLAGYILKVTIVLHITINVIGVKSLIILPEYVGQPDTHI